MTEPRTRRTRSGCILTDEAIEQMATEFGAQCLAVSEPKQVGGGPRNATEPGRSLPPRHAVPRQ